jgi:hypothetical protein
VRTTAGCLAADERGLTRVVRSSVVYKLSIIISILLNGPKFTGANATPHNSGQSGSRGRIHQAAWLVYGYATLLKLTALSSTCCGPLQVEASGYDRGGAGRHRYQSIRPNTAEIANPRIKVVVDGNIIPVLPLAAVSVG